MSDFDLSSVLSVEPAQETTVAEPEAETHETEQTESIEHSQEKSEEKPEDPAIDPEEQVDARKNPAKIRQALKAFRDASPEHAQAARELNDAYGRYEGYKQVFPRVEDARAASELLTNLGGKDGIATLQLQAAEMDEMDTMLAAGDPRILEKLKDANLGAIVPSILANIEKSSPEQYTKMMQPALVKGLATAGFEQALSSLWDSLPEGSEGAQKLIQGMYTWFKGQQAEAEKSKTDAVHPMEEKLTQREQDLVKRETEIFNGQVGSQLAPWVNQQVDGQIADKLKGFNLSPETKAYLAKSIRAEIGKLGEKDQIYNNQIKQALSPKNRKVDTVLGLAKNQIGKVIDQASKNAIADWKAIAGAPSKQASKPAAARTAPVTSASAGNVVKVAQKPTEYDRARTTTDMLIRQQAYLKDGRIVSWNVLRP